MSKLKNYDDVKIEYWVENTRDFPEYHFKVYTDITGFAKISGHRFVSLVDHKSVYENDLSTLLQFLGRAPFIENDFMKVGSALEIPVIKASETQFGLERAYYNFGFEDLDNGNENFHFIRDMMFEEDGKSYIGEVKTFYNKKKVNLSDENPLPKPHMSWWLQTRLETSILKKPAKIFFYYVTPTTKQAVLKGRTFTIKPKYLFMSDVIGDVDEDTEEDIIKEYYEDFGFTTFNDLINYALMRREDMMDEYYTDDKGNYYYVKVPLKTAWYGKLNHVEQYLEDIAPQIKIKEIGRNGT